MVREQDRRDLFTDDELEQIFSADWFKKGANAQSIRTLYKLPPVSLLVASAGIICGRAHQ
jgi:hypothetical protein